LSNDNISGILAGRRLWFFRFKLRLFILKEAFRFHHHPAKAYRELKMLQQVNRNRTGNIIVKMVRSGRRYYFTTDYPGYPSANLSGMLRNEFAENNNGNVHTLNTAVLKTLVWGITNRCPLTCAHCYEWDNIDKRDTLDMPALKQLLSIYKSNGLRHIQFSGGEPLARFEELAELVKEASPTMDCWLLTSGYGLTGAKAAALKKAGLTGAHISLDHWDEDEHNKFRNNRQSYMMVMEAIRNCISSGILVSLSLCATREFVTYDNLMKYADLAKKTGVQFLRILEPREAGKFCGREVRLSREQVDLISKFVVTLNTDRQFRRYPIAAFLGYHQRKTDCYGAGNRFLYVDPNGDVHACPFCRGSMGNLLDEPYDHIIRRVRQQGCRFMEQVVNA